MLLYNVYMMFLCWFRAKIRKDSFLCTDIIHNHYVCSGLCELIYSVYTYICEQIYKCFDAIMRVCDYVLRSI